MPKRIDVRTYVLRRYPPSSSAIKIEQINFCHIRMTDYTKLKVTLPYTKIDQRILKLASRKSEHARMSKVIHINLKTEKNATYDI